MVEPGRGRAGRRLAAAALALALAGAIAAGVLGSRPDVVATPPRPAAALAQAHVVGAAACGGCHATEQAAWQGSQHRVALQPAVEGSVLAPFRGERFTSGGATTTFHRRDGRFVVNTQGPDGRLHDYDVVHAIGVEPLQQYLLALPGGALQALPIAWDARPARQGGQRWFDLQGAHPAPAGDELHWTGRQQNANFMCIDCHVTAFRKNFDAATRRYASTWAESGVACEACHGPGSRHVEWAARGAGWQALDGGTKGLVQLLDERRGVHWTISAATGNAVRSAPPGLRDKELQVCARCHSHRSQIAEDDLAGAPLADTHVPSLLDAGLYWPDGQARAEVYDHGSFLQSRMHQRGVTCSDCHDPHSGSLRQPGNAVCSQCHASVRYDAPGHHHHEPGSAGAQCAACHLPPATYMRIDARHDHFIRVPRPDASPALGTPDACTGCHAGKEARRAVAQARRWYPGLALRPQPLAEALGAMDKDDERGSRLLDALIDDPAQSAIVRATALSRLPADLTRAQLERVGAALADPDAAVRGAAVESLAGAEPAVRARLLAPRLRDPVRAVRIAAARWLAALPAGALDTAWQAALAQGVADYEAVQRFNADRPESYVNLGTLYADQGDVVRAEAALRQALALAPTAAAAALELADLDRQAGREPEAEELIRSVLRREPHNAAARHALGLSLLRQRRTGDALAELREAVDRDPGNARHAYVHALALDAVGRDGDAIRILEAARRRHPDDRDLLRALVACARRLPDVPRANDAARRLARLDALH